MGVLVGVATMLVVDVGVFVNEGLTVAVGVAMVRVTDGVGLEVAVCAMVGLDVLSAV